MSGCVDHQKLPEPFAIVWICQVKKMTLQTGSSGNNINIEETKKIRVLDLSLDRQQQILDKLDEIENVINTTLFNLRDICYFLGTKNVKTLEFTSVGFNQTSWNQAKLCK